MAEFGEGEGELLSMEYNSVRLDIKVQAGGDSCIQWARVASASHFIG